ncbi:MAG: galactose-1-phosphate uridylyltransferase, partial [Calditrichaeota bacterium]
MKKLNLNEHPHRRFNPLTGEWILVSPHRSKRPWQGQVEEVPVDKLKKYDPDCYLCPGNTRAGGKKNPEYKNTFVFNNDFSALKPDTPFNEFNKNGILKAQGEPGICRVVCFSPRHDLTLPEMTKEEIRTIVNTWVNQYDELGSMPEINHVQIFENKGIMMGCSNPHPHGQIWAQQTIPDEPRKEFLQLSQYYDLNNSCLLCDYLQLELDIKERIVLENDDFVALVPFWAV